MTEVTHARLPQHLRKYVVEQNYARYTPETKRFGATSCAV